MKDDDRKDEAKPRGIPLSLGEARLVAKQIRDSRGRYADVEYWPWVIEELIARVEALEAEKRVQS